MCPSYVQFHPLAYLVKLNIEMIMANLIKRIAVSTARKTGHADFAKEFQSDSQSNHFSRRQSGTMTQQDRNGGHFHELDSVTSFATDKHADLGVVSVAPAANQIKQTREVVITREVDTADNCGPVIEITGGRSDAKITPGRPKSMTGMIADSPPKHSDASDDDLALVRDYKW